MELRSISLRNGVASNVVVYRPRTRTCGAYARQALMRSNFVKSPDEWNDCHFGRG